jgi:hypothetical protein
MRNAARAQAKSIAPNVEMPDVPISIASVTGIVPNKVSAWWSAGNGVVVLLVNELIVCSWFGPYLQLEGILGECPFAYFSEHLRLFSRMTGQLKRRRCRQPSVVLVLTAHLPNWVRTIGFIRLFCLRTSYLSVQIHAPHPLRFVFAETGFSINASLCTLGMFDFLAPQAAII